MSEVGPLSRRGKCAGCGEWAMVEAALQMRAKAGPMYERYRERRAEAMRRELESLGD